MVCEGLATWLAGAIYNETFEEGLKKISLQIKNNDTVSLDDIISFKYRNSFNNNPFYITGGVICKMVYEKYGQNGIFELLICPNNVDLLKSELKKLSNLPY